MKRILTIVIVGSSVAATALPAFAQDGDRMWRCRDRNGKTEFTNVRSATAGRDCRLVEERVTVVPATQKSARSATRNKTPAKYPKESSTKRASAKEKQREILERELEQVFQARESRVVRSHGPDCDVRGA